MRSAHKLSHFQHKISFFSLGLVTLISLGVGLQGCSKKAKEEESSLPTSLNADVPGGGDSDSGKASGLQTVTFPYDSNVLDSSAKSKLKENAEILKSRSNLKVQIEGHCDERGGIQYNIALGERRANAARNFLVEAGIAGDRLTIISYGKERPVDPRSSEDAWSKNRRANFVITSQ